MTEKFKVGDRVYDIRLGVGVVSHNSLSCPTLPYPVEAVVAGIRLHYTIEGRCESSHLNPTLLTIPEARARGYDVPKEKVKKTETQYCYVFNNGTISGQRFRSRELAEGCTRDYTTITAIAECVFTWEEEV